MPPLIALLDANVLYPAELRSFLMYLAVPGVYRAKWSKDIHEEWMSNLLINRPDLTRVQLERTRELMDKNAPEALVTEYESLMPSLSLPDEGDRHVLAAAIQANCPIHHPKKQPTKADASFKAEQDKNRREEALANATGIRVLQPIAAAVPVRLR